MPDFLLDREGPRPWNSPTATKEGIKLQEYFLGSGQYAVEVAVAEAETAPTRTAAKKVWKDRQGNQPSPLLLVVIHGERATLCGPVGPEPLVFEELEVSQAERIATAALEEPDRHAAVRLIRASLTEVESELPGLHNVGMFATHELREGLPNHKRWKEATREGDKMLGLSGRDLVQALGFDIEPKGPTTNVLRVKEDGAATAIAVFLDESERPEVAGGRFQDSPVSTGLARGGREQRRCPTMHSTPLSMHASC